MRRPTIVVAALVLGAFLAVAAAYVRDLLFSGVSYPREIEKNTGLRVSAVVPRAAHPHIGWSRPALRGRAGNGLLAGPEPPSPIPRLKASAVCAPRCTFRCSMAITTLCCSRARRR